LRVVGGEFRGRPLVAPPTRQTRPTSDRLRETIFDVLFHRYNDPVSGMRVLDLFAGTGALGIEALSRGAASCLMVEKSAEARGAIRKNIESLNLTGRARVYRRDATRLGDIEGMQPFGLFFADPPYALELGAAGLASAGAGNWLMPGALGVLEETAKDSPMLLPGFTVLNERTMSDSKIVFLRWEPSI
jgi:16S rRNA (guanine966-N2)-methyltransferase